MDERESERVISEETRTPSHFMQAVHVRSKTAILPRTGMQGGPFGICQAEVRRVKEAWIRSHTVAVGEAVTERRKEPG